MPTVTKDLPRRIYLELNTPAELAIRAAVNEVEAAGCDPLLTDAVNLLSQAREKVADFVDGKPRSAPAASGNVKTGASMKATVGRIVHFYSEAIANKDLSRIGYGLNGQGEGPYVATVTQVFPGGDYVNLKVIGWGIDAWDEGSVSELPAGAEPGAHSRYWVWPPREVEMAPITGQALDPKTGAALPLSGEASVSI